MNIALYFVSILVQLLAINAVGKNKNGEVVAFWNLFAEGDFYKPIIKEQAALIESSGLLNLLDKVYFATMGLEGENVTFDNPKYNHIRYFGKHAKETSTLSLISQHCKLHESSKVLYFHNKGSHHPSRENDIFRAGLNCLNLNPGCVKALDTYDTCGMRISPVPHLHYCGNYWWARCSHINKLIDPLANEKNLTFVKNNLNLVGGYWNKSMDFSLVFEPDKDMHYYKRIYERFASESLLGTGRYFAETWLTSLPDFKPTDCMTSGMDNKYMSGYDVTDSMRWLCNTTQTFKCDAPAIFKNHTVFQGEFNKHNGWRQTESWLVRRSMDWYGAPPVEHLRWFRKFNPKK